MAVPASVLGSLGSLLPLLLGAVANQTQTAHVVISSAIIVVHEKIWTVKREKLVVMVPDIVWIDGMNDVQRNT